MDTRRLVLFVIFSMSILMLWDAWQRQQAPVAVVQQAAVQNTIPAQANQVASQAIDAMAGDYKLQQAQRISVKTDLYQAEIETTGGDLRKLTLLKHRAADNDTNNFVLLDDSAQPMTYVAQSGLLGTDLPTHHALFSSTANSYEFFDWCSEYGTCCDNDKHVANTAVSDKTTLSQHSKSKYLNSFLLIVLTVLRMWWRCACCRDLH